MGNATYVCYVTPAEVRAQLQANVAIEDHESVAGDHTQSSQTESKSVGVNSSNVLQTPSLENQPRKKART